MLTSLNDPDPHLREHAIKLCEHFVDNGGMPEPLWDRLQSLCDDPDICVRYQLAFTLGEVKNPGRIAVLEKIARRDVNSRWVRGAVLSSLSNGAADMFASVSADPGFLQGSGAKELLYDLVRLVGAGKVTAEAARVLDFAQRAQDPALSLSVLRALQEGLHRSGSSLANALGKERVSTVFARAAKVSGDRQAAEQARMEAIRLLGVAPLEQAGPVLLPLIGSGQPHQVELAALSTLAHFTEPKVGEELVACWPALNSQSRSAALSALLARPDRAAKLLAGVQNGAIARSELSTTQQKFLREHRDADVRRLAEQVLGPYGASSRQKVLESYQPALRLTGDAAKGTDIYLQRCSSCHRLEGQGFALGPDLVTVKQAGKEKMLGNILDPNREVAPQYIAFEIETKEDESYVGIIASETTSTLTVLQAFGKKDVIPRTHLKSMRSLGQSLMPEGLDAGLSAQDFANLLEFISTARANAP
ncbi:MAG TPA: HEAT repeat domain-containing protein [Verrucomicrobiae bacterium]|nr:HEAT repeat domain-containing protein [Verrucomicrobiae bacterium]